MSDLAYWQPLTSRFAMILLATKQTPQSRNSYVVERFRRCYAGKRIWEVWIRQSSREVEFMVESAKQSKPNAANAVVSLRARTKATVAITSAALVLSLITWYLFYVARMPLDAFDTSIVAGFWLLVVTMSRWLFGWIVAKRKRRAHK
jgi:hypothetical protein